MKNLNFLALNTKKILLSLSELNELRKYTLVGGSALSIYLKHRLSNDLDFFTWENEIETKPLLIQIKNLYTNNFKIENISKKQLDLKIFDVKITFFANNWSELKKNNKNLVNNIYIAPIELLTAMKLNTLFLRAKFRDYYDLFVINKKIYTITEMYDIIKKYMPEINKKLFQIALVFTDDIEEDAIKHLKPKYNVNLTEIKKHFEKEIYAWLYNT